MLPTLLKNTVVFHLCLVSLMLVGCSSSSPQTPNARAGATSRSNDPLDLPLEARVSRLRLGMSKSQVIAIMGDNGREGGVSQSAHGTYESLTYLPGFGTRYARNLKSGYTFGLAGHSKMDVVSLQFQNGRLSHIHSH